MPVVRRAGVAAPQPEAPDLSAFAAALSSYSAWIDRYTALPPDQNTDALRHALDAAADAVAVMPLSQDLAPAEIAANIHTLAGNFAENPPLSPEQSTVARDTFQRIEAVLSLAANQHYQDAPAVADAVGALHLQYMTIDPSKPLGSNLELVHVLGSLGAVERVFRTMALVVANGSAAGG